MQTIMSIIHVVELYAKKKQFDRVHADHGEF